MEVAFVITAARPAAAAPIAAVLNAAVMALITTNITKPALR